MSVGVQVVNSVSTTAATLVYRNINAFALPTLTAIPLRSEEDEAAVGLVLGTVFVLVSVMWIFSEGTPRQRVHTCRGKGEGEGEGEGVHHGYSAIRYYNDAGTSDLTV